MVIRTKRGLDLPLKGKPRQSIQNAAPARQVALLGDDYPDLKPTMAVKSGDPVRKGQLLFTDKKNPQVHYTSPAAGIVTAIERGHKRRLLSVIIDVKGDEQERFTAHGDDTSQLTREIVIEQLLKSGAWTSLRTRPYSKVPDPSTTPHSIFVTAIDTNPLAPDPQHVIDEQPAAFVAGLQIISRLSDGPIHLCTAEGPTIPGRDVAAVEVHEFAGPHPAGLPGTHIHFIDPVTINHTVWYIHYQDVIAIGNLFRSGELDNNRVISIAGPPVTNPRLLRTQAGTNLYELATTELEAGQMETDIRLISGSVLSGRHLVEPVHFLGRYHYQLSILEEGREREFLGWQRPGWNKFSIKRVFASALTGRSRQFDFTTSLQGSPRAMVPIGCYEKIMPLDILPTFLLRALIVGDTEQAQQLGCLELDEEDIALCTFVCPGKYEYGSILRENLAQIEEEG